MTQVRSDARHWRLDFETEWGDVVRVAQVRGDAWGYAFAVPASDPPQLIGPVWWAEETDDGHLIDPVVIDALPVYDT